MTDVLLRERRGALLVLTMNRPERRNALTPEMARGLFEAMTGAAQDTQVRAVLLTGAAGHFCAGGDVKAMAKTAGTVDPEERRRLLTERASVSRIIHDMPKPVVAAIEGAAAGAGLSMALACDLRIASETAKLTTAFAKVGLSGDYGGTWLLTHLLGAARARELYLTSPVLSGAEAARIGLVTRAVPEGTAVEEGQALASQLADGPSRAYAGIKQNIAAAEGGMGLAEAIELEARNFVDCSGTEDHIEAARAFTEKRAPVFRGR